MKYETAGKLYFSFNFVTVVIHRPTYNWPIQTHLLKNTWSKYVMFYVVVCWQLIMFVFHVAGHEWQLSSLHPRQICTNHWWINKRKYVVITCTDLPCLWPNLTQASIIKLQTNLKPVLQELSALHKHVASPWKIYNVVKIVFLSHRR